MMRKRERKAILWGSWWWWRATFSIIWFRVHWPQISYFSSVIFISTSPVSSQSIDFFFQFSFPLTTHKNMIVTQESATWNFSSLAILSPHCPNLPTLNIPIFFFYCLLLFILFSFFLVVFILHYYPSFSFFFFFNYIFYLPLFIFIFFHTGLSPH